MTPSGPVQHFGSTAPSAAPPGPLRARLPPLLGDRVAASALVARALAQELLLECVHAWSADAAFDEDALRDLALATPAAQEALAGAEPRRVIVRAPRLVNIVV